MVPWVNAASPVEVLRSARVPDLTSLHMALVARVAQVQAQGQPSPSPGGGGQELMVNGGGRYQNGAPNGESQSSEFMSGSDTSFDDD